MPLPRVLFTPSSRGGRMLAAASSRMRWQRWWPAVREQPRSGTSMRSGRCWARRLPGPEALLFQIGVCVGLKFLLGQLLQLRAPVGLLNELTRVPPARAHLHEELKEYFSV